LGPIPAGDKRLPIRRGRRKEKAAAIAIDQLAFDEFWRFDEASFDEAVEATPVSRFRVALNRERSQLVGYAIAGRAARTGYLQRLAVDPSAQGHGIGTALVVDTLRALRRRSVVKVLVNTQEANQSAFDLYVRLGFIPVVPGLAVLEIDL
jgi:ribosomal protein S18 acetylase RimI-like enzyme